MAEFGVAELLPSEINHEEAGPIQPWAPSGARHCKLQRECLAGAKAFRFPNRDGLSAFGQTIFRAENIESGAIMLL
jgi:hypothetical protein